MATRAGSSGSGSGRGTGTGASQGQGGKRRGKAAVVPELSKEEIDESLVHVTKMVEAMEAEQAQVRAAGLELAPEQEKRLVKLKRLVRDARRRKRKLELKEEFIEEEENEIRMALRRIQVAKAMGIPNK